MKKNIFISISYSKTGFQKMLVPFFADAPDSNIAFSKLIRISFVDSCFCKFDQISIECTAKSTITGNDDQQYFFNWSFSCQSYSSSAAGIAHDIAEHLLHFLSIRTH